MIKKLAKRLDVEVTPDILKLKDTSKISDTLITKALAKGKTPEQID